MATDECCNTPEKKAECLDACTASLTPLVCTNIEAIENSEGSIVTFSGNNSQTVDYVDNGFPSWNCNGVDNDVRHPIPLDSIFIFLFFLFDNFKKHSGCVVLQNIIKTSFETCF